jgi:hypothetical protein
MLHITADNCWEVWINGVYLTRSATAKVAGWELTNLHEASVATTGWQTVGHVAVPGAMLNMGSNTITILAANEYYWTDDGNSPSPPYVASPYRQQNPGALIFKLDVEYEEFVAAPEITVVKEATEVNDEPIGEPKEALEGDTITYDYTVTNTGNVPLYDVELWDDMGTVDTADDVQIVLSGLTDEDGDTYLDDLAVSASATGTRDYVVPWFTAGPVTNEATAWGWYDSTKYSNTDDESVAILHNPDIEVEKSGPPSVGYFLSTNATYTYIVTNPGNCSLDVDLTDDLTGAPVYQSGDANGNGYLDPGETWTYTDSQLLECTGPDQETFTNTATAVGTDAVGGSDIDQDDWSVTIFQWLPGRTIGYWSNWDNHFGRDCITEMVGRVDAASSVFNSLTADSVYAIIKAQDQKGKMDVAKAKVLLSKQLMAAWLNVQSGIGATDGNPATCGSMDAALWQYATVYLSKVSGAEALFGAPTMSVIQVLQTVEAKWNIWTADQLLLAKDVLDLMNNAQNNGYFMFMAP